MTIGLLTALWKKRVAPICLERTLKAAQAIFDVRPVAVYSSPKDKAVAENAGFEAVRFANDPLSDKFNAGYEALKGVDGVIQFGSDDVLSVAWIKLVAQWAEDHDAVWSRSCLFYDLPEARLYAVKHAHCNVGSFLRRDLLGRMQWAPYPSGLNTVLDRGLKTKTLAAARNRAIAHDILKFDAPFVDIKTDQNITSSERLSEAYRLIDLDVQAFDRHFGGLFEQLAKKQDNGGT